MRNALKVVLPLLVVAVGALIAWTMIATAPAPEVAIPEPEPPLVRAIEVEPRTVRLTVESQGTVRPATESTIIAEVAGSVIRTSPSLEPGGFFTSGQVLAELDRREYELALAQAQSGLADARLQLAREQQEAEVARREWEELGRGTPSPLALRILQMEQAQAAVEAAEAALQRARLDLERTRIRAPYEGRVRERNVDLGQFVNRGMAVATVYSIAFAEVVLPIADEEAGFIDLPLTYRGEAPTRAGSPVVLRATFAGREHEWQGRIVRTEGELDPQTRTIRAVARVDDPYGRRRNPTRPPLAVGMFVRAEILGRTVSNAFVLPREAVRANRTVHVVDERGRLAFREIDVIRRGATRVIAAAGLAPGDLVIISALDAPVQGMAVRVQLADPAEFGLLAGGSP